ncbi:MAG: hypothetical protein DWI71_02290 [Chloroflexi bacterium]|nr:MAG: hypothetical protein DWI71_02290 [Chloroflexota bacterium]
MIAIGSCQFRSPCGGECRRTVPEGVTMDSGNEVASGPSRAEAPVTEVVATRSVPIPDGRSAPDGATVARRG